MIPAFVEGGTAIGLPCSLVLIVPVLAVALAVPARPLIAVTVAIAGSTAAMWLRASGLVSGGLETWGSVVLAVSTIAVLVAWRYREWAPRHAVALAIAPGLLAGWMWQPCVGTELGSILTAVGQRDATSPAWLAAYVVGVTIPAYVVALARVAVGDAERPRRVLAVVGTAVGCLLGGLVVLGVDDRIIGWLVRIST